MSVNNVDRTKEACSKTAAGGYKCLHKAHPVTLINLLLPPDSISPCKYRHGNQFVFIKYRVWIRTINRGIYTTEVYPISPLSMYVADVVLVTLFVGGILDNLPTLF